MTRRHHVPAAALGALALCCLLVPSQALAVCPFSSPIGQGGLLARPNGGIVTASPVAGFWWELGMGDPVGGAGNDLGATAVATPPAVDAVWISRTTPRGLPAVQWDWFNGGTDGCLSGGAGSGVMVFYLIDGNDDYVIAAVTGVSTPVPSHDLDTVLSGVGPTGHDLPLVPRVQGAVGADSGGVQPFPENVAIVDPASVTADIAPAIDSVNSFSDLGVGMQYAGVVDTSALNLIHRTPGGGDETAIPGCPHDTGCNGVTLPRDREICWDPATDANAIAIEMAGPAVCVGGTLDGFPCTPGNPGDPCLAFVGVCPPGPSVVTPFGPPIPGGCFLMGGPTVDDHAVVHALGRSRGFRVFRWDATEFAVSHYNVLDLTRGGERIVNPEPIRSIGSNGAVVSYEFLASGKELRGGREFAIQMVRTDGQELRFDVPQ